MSQRYLGSWLDSNINTYTGKINSFMALWGPLRASRPCLLAILTQLNAVEFQFHKEKELNDRFTLARPAWWVITPSKEMFLHINFFIYNAVKVKYPKTHNATS